MAPDYDVIVVGAGAGGGIVAGVLAEAGRRVLLVERGAARTYADSGHRDHLRNHRLSLYGHNTGPPLEGHPRVLVDPEGVAHTAAPNEAGYHNNASCLGGGTFLYGAQAWRFLPDDFGMARRYGVPPGSSLVDWPFGYDEIEPWYDRAEREIGVAGAGQGRHGGPRTRPHPMPPAPAGAVARRLRGGAERLGIDTFAPPLLINTVPYNGRPACIRCGSCVGFPCPSDGKNGTQNTLIPRALATGLCDVMTDTVAARVETDARGIVTGVALIEQASTASPVRRMVRARAVVLAAGAIETARLLLLSANERHPAGLGNHSGQVGRHLQGHAGSFLYGLFDEDLQDSRGPGVTIATNDFNHGNDGVIGGGLIADDFTMLPVIFWKSALPPDVPRWGLQAKDFMRRNYRRVVRMYAPTHEIPNPDSRVTLDPDMRDRHGLAVARLSGVVHDETLRTAAFMQTRVNAWLDASGALRCWGPKPARRLSAGQHQAGTCRMGDDPAAAVTDRWGRVWGMDNLFVADASLHPTNGGFNPVLTVMALAFRAADHVAARL